MGDPGGPLRPEAVVSWPEDERAFLGWAAGLGGCLICGQRAETHHTRGKRWHPWYIVRLCSHHHTGNAGVHTLGRRTFAARFRVCLPGQALIHLASYQGGGEDLAF